MTFSVDAVAQNCFAAHRELRFYLVNGEGEEIAGADDDIRVLDVTPQLDKEFSPTSVATGGVSTLTLTVTNTSDLAAKNGWSSTDSLPEGLTVADPSGTATTCPATDLAVAGRAMRDAAVTPRDALELQLVISVVHLRSGELDDARARFAQAVDVGRQGLLATFALFPRDEMLDLCRQTGTDPRDLGLADGPAGTRRTRTSVPIVLLTKRERAVLFGLAAGESPIAIAAEHGVSVNTVRTQIRKVYRKLDATSRASALARAGRLGLIPPEVPRKAQTDVLRGA